MPPANETPPKNLLTEILPWLFIVAALAGIVWLVISAAPEKRMSCSSAVQTTMTSFGTCSTN